MHLAWRWFTGLGFDQEIPHHSTFSKNRHGRFQESKLFEELFEQIVRQCVEVGLVSGKNLSVDGSFVEANAAKESRIPREQLAEAAQVHHTVRQYLREVEEQNPVEEPVHEQDQVSTTDPDSTYATKGGTPARLLTAQGVENKLGFGVAPGFAISYAAGALFLAGCHFYAARSGRPSRWRISRELRGALWTVHGRADLRPRARRPRHTRLVFITMTIWLIH